MSLSRKKGITLGLVAVGVTVTAALILEYVRRQRANALPPVPPLVHTGGFFGNPSEYRLAKQAMRDSHKQHLTELQNNRLRIDEVNKILPPVLSQIVHGYIEDSREDCIKCTKNRR